jgi:hypothetical protein
MVHNHKRDCEHQGHNWGVQGFGPPEIFENRNILAVDIVY